MRVSLHDFHILAEKRTAQTVGAFAHDLYPPSTAAFASSAFFYIPFHFT